MKTEDEIFEDYLIGKEYADDVSCGVFHLTIQIGYGQFTVGIADKEL